MVVKRGETGTYVKWLQQGLHIMCCYDGEMDSKFGAGTESGVESIRVKMDWNRMEWLVLLHGTVL